MFRALFNRRRDTQPQQPLQRSATTQDLPATAKPFPRSFSAPGDLLAPSQARVRQGGSSTRFGTPLEGLSAPQNAGKNVGQTTRRKVGEAQLQSARAASAVAFDSGAAVRALITLSPETLVTADVCSGHACAARLLAALRAHGIVDQNNRAVHAQSDGALASALKPLTLDAAQKSRVRDAVKVAHFLYEHGAHETNNSFDAELSCGKAFLQRQGAAGSWDAFLRELSNPRQDGVQRDKLQAALIDLSR